MKIKFYFFNNWKYYHSNDSLRDLNILVLHKESWYNNTKNSIDYSIEILNFEFVITIYK